MGQKLGRAHKAVKAIRGRHFRFSQSTIFLSNSSEFSAELSPLNPPLDIKNCQ